VLKSLEAIRTHSRQTLEVHQGMSGGDLWDNLSLDLRMFSDTLFLSVFLPPGKREFQDFPGYEETRRYMLLRVMVLTLSQSLAQAICGDVPLLYRGALSCGLYQTNDIAFLGPAVDDAGSYFEASEGAFIFLTEQAAEIYRKRPPLMSLPLPYFLPYNVPLKHDRVLKTFCLNPFFYVSSETHIAALQRLLGEFGDTPDLALKRDNTSRFLHLAKDAARIYRNA
jgi:hypothetical protein